jgi:hypothetical protein
MRRSGGATASLEPPPTATQAARRTAIEMIADCFRHQHPEAYGGAPVPGAILPNEVRYGRDDLPVSSPSAVIPEEPMGNPDAPPLP